MSGKKTRRKNLTQFATLIVAVVIVVVASVLFQQWWNNRTGPEPEDIQLTVTLPTGEQQISPFTVCEPGTDCAENPVPEIYLAEHEQLKITLPEDVYNHDWSLLTIYDQPAANDQTFFKAYERKEIDISGSIEPPAAEEDSSRPRLVVVEVSTVMIGHDDTGEETPYTVVWSMKIAE